MAFVPDPVSHVAAPAMPEPAAAAVAAPVPAVAQDAGASLPNVPNRRRLTAEERSALADIRSLFTSGEVARAAALVESAFRSRADACDRNGLPIYLVELLRCALALDDAAAAERIAAQLRPMLSPGDPMIEALAARAAMKQRDRGRARTAWLAALARAPGLPEATEFLARNPVSPDGGVAAIELVDGDRPVVLAPPQLTEAPHAALAGGDAVKLVPKGLPARLLVDANLSIAPDGSVEIKSGAPPGAARAIATDPSALALVLRHPDGLLRPHVFVEAVLAAFAAQRAFLPNLHPVRVYVGRQGWALPDAAVRQAAAKAGPLLQAELLAVLFPGIRVIGDFDGAVREPRVLLLDGGERNTATDTLIGGFMPQVVRRTVEARQRIFAAFGLPDTAEPPRVPGRQPRALFLQSPPPRALAEPVREKLFEMLRRGGYEVARVDMAALPWRRQVQLACGADLIVGAHSPALFSALWAHPQARVLEFFPEGTRRYDGQLLAEASALAYLGLEGVAERGFVIRARERWGPPVGKANRLVWALPWAMLEQTLSVGSAAEPAPAATPQTLDADVPPAPPASAPGATR